MAKSKIIITEDGQAAFDKIAEATRQSPHGLWLAFAVGFTA